jgi:hypothetical protein
MNGNEEDLSTFLMRFGFSEDELSIVMDELNSRRSIPGTTIERYLNRILDTIVEEARPAFLKGIMVGVAIKNAIDALEECDLSEEEKRIDHEIENLKFRG